MSQTTYRLNTRPAQEGVKYDTGFDSVLTYRATEQLTFGLAAQFVPNTNNDAKKPNTSSDPIIGVILKTHHYEQDPLGQDYYEVNDAVNIMSRGRVYVFTETAVSVGDPVYVRYDQGTSSNPLGAFTNTGAPSTGATVEVTNARYIEGSNSQNIAVVEFNLP